MRLRAHHPRQYPDGGASLPQEEKDRLFSLSRRIVEYDNLCHKTPAMRRFLWHVRVYFQWHSLIYLLSELRIRRIGDESDQVWQQIEDVYHNHTEMLTDRRYVLHNAIGSFTLKAWDAREAEHQRLGIPLQQPEFMSKLRAFRTTDAKAGRDQESAELAEQVVAGGEPLPLSGYGGWGASYDIPDMPSQGFSNTLGTLTEPTPMDWTLWDNLLQEFDMPVTNPLVFGAPPNM